MRYRCSECGKEIAMEYYVPSMWGYKVRGAYQCGYGCYTRAVEKQAKKRRYVSGTHRRQG